MGCQLVLALCFQSHQLMPVQEKWDCIIEESHLPEYLDYIGSLVEGSYSVEIGAFTTAVEPLCLAWEKPE